MSYKEGLDEARAKYEQKRMLDTLEKDDRFVNDICNGISRVFRRDYVENQRDSVSFCFDIKKYPRYS